MQENSAESATNAEQAAQSETRDADFSKLDEGVGETSPSQAAAAAQSGNSGSNAEIIKLKAEVEENKDKYLRALAELENFKKRALKERSELIRYQGERIIYDLLEVVDNLEWAIGHSSADPQKLKEGLELTHKLFIDALGRWEIRGVSAVGKEFDPVQHQAISKVSSAEAKPGTVINEFKKAYFYKDKLLRPADVVVSVGAEAEASSNEAQNEPESDSSN